MQNEYSPIAKRFVHNGITYHRQDDLVLFKIRNNNNEYLGVNWRKNKKSVFEYRNIFTTDSDNAFIFVLSREIFDTMLCATVIQDLKRQFNVDDVIGTELTPVKV